MACRDGENKGYWTPCYMPDSKIIFVFKIMKILPENDIFVRYPAGDLLTESVTVTLSGYSG